MSDQGKRKVVYWLGAGASRFALPVVEEMPQAFDHHIGWLRRKYITTLAKLDFEGYATQIKQLAYYASRFGTVDTYAKALGLQNDQDGLASLKLHMSLYFLLEQLSEDKYPAALREANLYMRDRRQDLRYMGWLAVLLEKVDRLNQRVNVISWNYDLQVEHALAYYYNLKSPDLQNALDVYGVYPNPHTASKPEVDTPFLIHLNGIAGNYSTSEKVSDSLFATLDRENDRVFIGKVFERYKKKQEGFNAAMNEWFTFAWENNPVAVKGRELALKAMSEASILVVIGYSFPPFNRTIDRQLMRAFLPDTVSDSEKRVYLQSPSLTKETFTHLFGIDQRLPNIEVDNGVLQFYLPPELFEA